MRTVNEIKTSGLFDIHQKFLGSIIVDNDELMKLIQLETLASFNNLPIQSIQNEGLKSNLTLSQISHGVTIWFWQDLIETGTELKDRFSQMDKTISPLRRNVFVIIDVHGQWWKLYDRHWRGFEVPKKLHNHVIIICPPR